MRHLQYRLLPTYSKAGSLLDREALHQFCIETPVQAGEYLTVMTPTSGLAMALKVASERSKARPPEQPFGQRSTILTLMGPLPRQPLPWHSMLKYFPQFALFAQMFASALSPAAAKY